VETQKPVMVGRPSPDGKRIRVLLEENFHVLRIAHSTLGPLIRAEAAGRKIRIFRNEEKEPLSADSGFRFQPSNGKFLEVNGTPYRGLIDVFINPLGVPVAVNELFMESYLLSVVPKELGPEKYPEIEALKAQAVAARTFALTRIGAEAARGFDLYRDIRSQVYEGTRLEHPLTEKAVFETRGVIASYQGKPISSMYSSTCGGVTEAFHVLFSGPPIAYLKGGAACPDGKSPYRYWKEKIDIEALQKRIDRLRPKGIGRLRDVVPVDYSNHGRLIKARVIGDAGELTLEGNQVRYALGLRSSYITRLERRKNSEGHLRSLEVEGHGWGHGVGLCQIGAVELAARDWNYEKILKHYYSGIRLEKRY